jgi:hypothetical protein
MKWFLDDPREDIYIPRISEQPGGHSDVDNTVRFHVDNIVPWESSHHRRNNKSVLGGKTYPWLQLSAQ